MTRKLTILFFLLLLVSAWASSPDFIDDVYFWDDGSTPAERVSNVQPPTASAVQPPTSGITFIEDSITQHSDTIVKAIIRR